MIQSRTTWIAFAICLLVGATAVGYLTYSALNLEKREAAGVVQSDSERLALWRMESLLVPLIATENARPPISYQSFYPTKEAYSKLYAPIGKGEVLVPSPLLTFKSDYIKLHFELNGQQASVYCSPQVPVGNQRDLCEVYVWPSAQIELREAKLANFLTCAPVASVRKCVAQLPAEPTGNPTAEVEWLVPKNDGFNNYGNNLSLQKQQERNANELNRRSRSIQTNAIQMQQMAGPPSIAKDEKPVPPFTPMWVEDQLILLRRVTIDGREVVQGCWLDWPAIDKWLCGEVNDLLPKAALKRSMAVPATDKPIKLEDVNPLRLASLPVELIPGIAAETEVTGVTPMRLSLGTAWLGLLIASIAAGLLLFAALRMSQRRGAFVSAVTHELRTPLTTFRVYTDLLGDERQTDPVKRAGYVQTLRRQAERLDHLVDNVLSYARLENKNLEARAEDVRMSDLFARVEPTLRDLANQAGMKFTLDCPTATDLTIRADPEAVERILFNLVDNACKYGGGTDRKEIAISCTTSGSSTTIHVRDFGRGVAKSDQGSLFQEFSNSAADAAKSAPGVGLGLSLSRRLARCMRGDLALEKDITDGASFALQLPLA